MAAGGGYSVQYVAVQPGQPVSLIGAPGQPSSLMYTMPQTNVISHAGQYSTESNENGGYTWEILNEMFNCNWS